MKAGDDDVSVSCMIEEDSQYEVNVLIQVSLTIVCAIPRPVQSLHGILDFDIKSTSRVNCLENMF